MGRRQLCDPLESCLLPDEEKVWSGGERDLISRQQEVPTPEFSPIEQDRASAGLL